MATEIPDWIQQLGWIGAAISAIAGGITLGRKKGSNSDRGLTDDRKGEGVLLAGSLFERQSVIDLTNAIKSLDGTARQIRDLCEEMHREREIEREVQIQMLRKKGDL